MINVGEIDSGIRRHTVCGDLPQQDSKRPYIRLKVQRTDENHLSNSFAKLGKITTNQLTLVENLL